LAILLADVAATKKPWMVKGLEVVLEDNLSASAGFGCCQKILSPFMTVTA